MQLKRSFRFLGRMFTRIETVPDWKNKPIFRGFCTVRSLTDFRFYFKFDHCRNMGLTGDVSDVAALPAPVIHCRKCYHPSWSSRSSSTSEGGNHQRRIMGVSMLKRNLGPMEPREAERKISRNHEAFRAQSELIFLSLLLFFLHFSVMCYACLIRRSQSFMDDDVQYPFHLLRSRSGILHPNSLPFFPPIFVAQLRVCNADQGQSAAVYRMVSKKGGIISKLMMRSTRGFFADDL